MALPKSILVPVTQAAEKKQAKVAMRLVTEGFSAVNRDLGATVEAVKRGDVHPDDLYWEDELDPDHSGT